LSDQPVLKARSFKADDPRRFERARAPIALRGMKGKERPPKHPPTKEWSEFAKSEVPNSWLTVEDS
jgi:hypothetical protein